MAVVFRAANSDAEGTGTNFTVTEPAGAASGDWLIALATGDAAVTLGKPTGWTTLYSGLMADNRPYLVAYIQRGGSAPDLIFTFSSSCYRGVECICINSDTAGTITLDSSASGATYTAFANPNPPSTTAVATTSLAVCGGVWHSGSTNWGAPTNYTRRGIGTGMGVLATRSLSASGAEDPAAFSNAANFGADHGWHGFTATFTDAGGGGGRTTKNTRTTWLGMEVGMNWRGEL